MKEDIREMEEMEPEDSAVRDQEASGQEDKKEGWQVPKQESGGWKRIGGSHASGKGLCVLDVHRGFGQSSGSELKLCSKGRVVCEDIFHCRDYGRSFKYCIGPGIYV